MSSEQRVMTRDVGVSSSHLHHVQSTYKDDEDEALVHTSEWCRELLL